MDPVGKEFAAELRQRLGPSIRQVLLFGSRARGDAGKHSDYDMLVVVDQRTPDVRAAILDIETRLMDRYGVLVATVLRSEEEWLRAQGFPLGRNCRERGRGSVKDELRAMLAVADEKVRAARLL